jgi:hypothetical protein
MSVRNVDSGGTLKLEALSDVSTDRGVDNIDPVPEHDDTNCHPSNSNEEDRHHSTSVCSPSPGPRRCNTAEFPYVRFKSPVKCGRKVLGNIVSLVILGVSATYTVTAIIYYTNPPDPINNGLVNVLKELLCFLLAKLLVLSRFLKYQEWAACRRRQVNRETVSLILAVLGAIVHFYVLIRWYVQEGRVYVWLSDKNIPYTLEWDVKLIMTSVLVGFILNFVEFSLMLLTKMRPRYKDLNPHLTAFIENEKLLDHEALA